MPSKFYRRINGQLVELGVATVSEATTPVVQNDTMPPLKHPVTGKIYDSKSRYVADTRAMGSEIVGNDLLSKQRRDVPDRLTEGHILEAVRKAESIAEDPTKLREAHNRNLERLERNQQLLRERIVIDAIS